MERFGKELKKLRLKAGYGLRKFASMIEIAPSNLSAVEHGRRSMPAEKMLLAAEIVGLEKGSEDWDNFFDLAKQSKDDIPSDLKQLAVRGFIPALLRTIDNNQLTDQDIADLIEEIKAKDGSSQK